jgi:hypothetical protein
MEQDEMVKMALIVEGLEDLFQEAQIGILLEVSEERFKQIKSNFRDVDKTAETFSIKISNVDFVFTSTKGD